MKIKKRGLNLSVLEYFSVTLGFLLLSLVVTKSQVAPILTVGILIFIKIQGGTFRCLLSFLKIPLAFAFFGLISIVLVMGVEQPDTLWIISDGSIPLSITRESMQNGLIVLWRSLNSLLSLYLLVATTTASEKSELADKLRLPRTLVELGVLSFRYIQILNKKKQEILIAQRLRLGYSSFRRTLHSLSLLMFVVFVYSLTTFRISHQVLLSRGYTGILHYPATQMGSKDRKRFIVLIFLVLVLLLWGYNTYFKE